MKQRNFRSTILIFLLSALAINANAQTSASDLQQLIHEKDSLFWNAYNHCDIASCRKYLADDVEFYHDKGGITLGAEALLSTLENNLCKRQGFKLRRALVPGSLYIYPMEKNGTIYGAVISGDHDFFITENGKPEFNSGRAKFTHLWLLSNSEWKMSRILSYDHKAKE
jgi:hypothetical protein